MEGGRGCVGGPDYPGIRATEGESRAIGNKKLSLKAKFLKTKILFVTVYSDDNDEDNNNVFKNNFNRKFWAIVRQKLSAPPGDPD
jgi:hypothetical protein